MDLGFGNANQAVGNATAQALLQTAKAQEAALDQELSKYDDLLNDDDALDMLRERRLQQMKLKQKQRQEYQLKGHGTYDDIAASPQGGDIAKAFFEMAKESERCVVHFYRPTTRYCEVFHKHLAQIAQEHVETKFVKVNVEPVTDHKGLQYLVEKLGIQVMPTVVLIKKRQAVHHIRGFDDLGGSENFSTMRLKQLLTAHGVLQMTESELDLQGDEDEEEELNHRHRGFRIG